MKKADLFAFFETLEKLKRTPRTGWVERGVKDPESVSDHSFRMTVMAMALAEELDCDTDHLVRLCLVHDLHESVCGDLILDYSRFGGTFKGLSPAEKTRREKRAMTKLFALLPVRLRAEWTRLWNEADAGKTPEARVLKELDRLEMLLQAGEYERKKNFRAPIFDIFYANNEKRVTHPRLRDLLALAVKKTRSSGSAKPF
jgi:putative hydrolase of HD superfamily